MDDTISPPPDTPNAWARQVNLVGSYVEWLLTEARGSALHEAIRSLTPDDAEAVIYELWMRDFVRRHRDEAAS